MLKVKPEDYDKIRMRREEGKSLTEIAKEFNISPQQVWRILNKLKQQSSQSINMQQSNTKGMSDDNLQVKLALQERRIEELSQALSARDKVLEDIQKAQQEIINQLKEFTKKPLQMEKHDDKLQVSCPNCGTTGTYQLEKVAPKSFDEILDYFDQPHEGGFDALHCKNCRPKIEQKLREHGFELKEIGKK